MMGRIKELGVADLDTIQLKSLFDWTQSASSGDEPIQAAVDPNDPIKPSFNQLNLDVCCSIPSDMKDFATSRGIRLLTHNDPRDFVPSDRLLNLLKAVNFPNAEDWNHLWALRYSIVSTGNGVIQSKGYLMAVIRK